MSVKSKHYANIGDMGDISFEDIAKFKQECLNNKGKRVYLTISKVVKSRSGNQNAYFHSVIVPYIARAMGEDDVITKEVLKAHLLTKNLDNGMSYVKNTSELTTVEFEEFCAKCRMLASQMWNCYVPLPHECEY